MILSAPLVFFVGWTVYDESKNGVKVGKTYRFDMQYMMTVADGNGSTLNIFVSPDMYTRFEPKLCRGDALSLKLMVHGKWTSDPISKRAYKTEIFHATHIWHLPPKGEFWNKIKDRPLIRQAVRPDPWS